jgi:protein-disulfide isomerase
VALVMIGGLWLYRRAHLVHQRQRADLGQYKALVTTLQQDPAFLLREHAAQPRHVFALRRTEPTGADHHQLAVFTDFACPACFCNAAEIHDEVVKTFGGRLDVLVRHYPRGDDGAARAAEAARELGGQDAFYEMYRRLFVNRDRLGPALYRELAAQIGLDPDELLRAMDGPDVSDVVAADIALARRLGVAGTPTMFLDGRRVTEICRSPVFWEAVAATPPPDGSGRLASSRTHQPPLGAASDLR